MTNSKTCDKKVVLASPRGFCAGVVRAIDIVNLALDAWGQPLYVRREIVHNKSVVNELRRKGITFVNEVDEVPCGSRVIFSAHGVSPKVTLAAKERKLKIIDATCPLVTKVHIEAIRYARHGYTIIMIGHADHDEVIGTLGEAPDAILILDPKGDVDRLEVADPEKIACLTQTTLSLNETRHISNNLRRRFPSIRTPTSDDICYATQRRQSAVLDLTEQTDLILVVGSANSSNSRRLVEVAQGAGTTAHLIDDIEDIQDGWLSDIRSVGLTAGASAPEDLVKKVVRYLNAKGYPSVESSDGNVERIEFPLPAELARIAADRKNRPGL